MDGVYFKYMTSLWLQSFYTLNVPCDLIGMDLGGFAAHYSEVPF